MKVFRILPLVLCCFGLSAQSTTPRLICGNEIFSDVVRKHYPELHDGFRATFEAARARGGQRVADPLTVRVVVHVVWNEPEENLHDSIILDQIRILNADFNRLNSDTAHTRALFKPEAGIADIQFELAEIVRVETDRLFEIDILAGVNLLPEVKHDADGGSDAWNTEEYLNIWVCHIQPIEIFGIVVGQVLGFAFPPNNLPHWPPDVGAPSPDEDGVVIDYRVFGSNNPNQIDKPDGSGLLNVRGRTPVHEVGHYLGLRHIWGDGGVLGPNDCAQSDGVDDTPYANAQSGFDCDTVRNTCDQIEDHYGIDAPDMVENYMDYADEGCANLFTKGQVGIMRNVLLGPRMGLLGPPAGIADHDASRGFSVYPNPASHTLNVRVDQDIRMQCLRLLSSDGKVIYSEKQYAIGNEIITIPVAGYRDGLYLVQVYSETGNHLQRVVIQGR